MESGTIEGALKTRTGSRPWIYGFGLATGILAGLVAVAYRVLALGTGLSLGREGPSIQLGALVGSGLSALSRRPELGRNLVTAGAAAGIAAAFNTALAGVLFCVEELRRSVSPVMLGTAMLAAVAADAVSILLLGLPTRPHPDSPEAEA